jgi:hypothetical protein
MVPLTDHRLHSPARAEITYEYVVMASSGKAGRGYVGPSSTYEYTGGDLVSPSWGQRAGMLSIGTRTTYVRVKTRGGLRFVILGLTNAQTAGKSTQNSTWSVDRVAPLH